MTRRLARPPPASPPPETATKRELEEALTRVTDAEEAMVVLRRLDALEPRGRPSWSGAWTGTG